MIRPLNFPTAISSCPFLTIIKTEHIITKIEHQESFMELCGLDHYEPLKEALAGTGFEVQKVEKQGKKTVIIVIREEGEEKPVFGVSQSILRQPL
jgi:hypothetical protein